MLPNPTVFQLRWGNSLASRAKQFSSVSITFPAIPIYDLRFIAHTDYSSKDVDGTGKTQGGYIIAATNGLMERGSVAPWGPLLWRSSKMRRVVNSTLSGESAVLVDGLGHVEWMCSFFGAALIPSFTLTRRKVAGQFFRPVVVIDCKSVYDHILKPGTTAGVGDKRCAIDLAIAKEMLAENCMTLRWGPTGLMLADALTKDRPEPADLLRSVLKHGMYQLADERGVLAKASEERDRRRQKAQQGEKGIVQQPVVASALSCCDGVPRPPGIGDAGVQPAGRLGVRGSEVQSGDGVLRGDLREVSSGCARHVSPRPRVEEASDLDVHVQDRTKRCRCYCRCCC